MEKVACEELHNAYSSERILELSNKKGLDSWDM
jgi:hypothetical protein